MEIHKKTEEKNMIAEELDQLSEDRLTTLVNTTPLLSSAPVWIEDI